MNKFDRARAEIDRIIMDKIQYANKTDNQRLAFALRNEAKILNNSLTAIEQHINEIKTAYETKILMLQDKDLERRNKFASLSIQMFNNLSKRTTVKKQN